MNPTVMLATATAGTEAPLLSAALLLATAALLLLAVVLIGAGFRSATRAATSARRDGDSRPDDCMI